MPVTDYVPTVDLVASSIMSRTRDQYGNILGVFSGATNPTDTQVEAVIGSVLNEVADEIGDDIPAVLWDDAQGVVAKRAAMQVELSYFPDQVSTGRSPYAQLKEEYEEQLAKLTKQVIHVEEGGGTGPVEEAAASNKPSWSFPVAQNWDKRVW
jgi:hypothetical protein